MQLKKIYILLLSLIKICCCQHIFQDNDFLLMRVPNFTKIVKQVHLRS